MNRKGKKPKILLPRRLAPLCESVEDSDSNNSTLKDGNLTLPLSSTMAEGKTRSARKLKRVMEELSTIMETSEDISNHQFNSVVQPSGNRENVVSPAVKLCVSAEKHRTGCPKCSGSAIGPDATGDSELTNASSNAAEDTGVSTTAEGSESNADADESSVYESSLAVNMVVQPPRHIRFPSESNMSAISELDQTSRLRISDVSATASGQSGGAHKEPIQKRGFDIIKLNDSGSKCEYQFVDGVHQRFCSSYLGNGFDVPSQIRFPCDPSLSAITSSDQNISQNTSLVSETTLTESRNVSENADYGPFCSSFRQDISQIPGHMTFNLDETVSDFTSQHYNLRKRKVVVPVQEESESEEDSTLKPTSDLESNFDSENDSQSSESEAKVGNSSCKWLTQHKLSCSICGSVRKAEEGDTSAEGIIRASGATKQFKCGQCEKSFGHKGNLNTHMLIHQGLKPHSCSTCNKSFTQLSNLNRHMLIHQGLKPHSCSTCNKSFTRLGDLKKHMLIHQGLKPHSCSTCRKSFTLLCNLVVHERVLHKGRKDHICTTCGTAFGQKGQLMQHMLSHGKERRFPCTACDKKFKHRSNLSRHRANVHQGKQNKNVGSDFN